MKRIALTLIVLMAMSGCSTFKFAPLATVEINDSGNGSANGNTATIPLK